MGAILATEAVARHLTAGSHGTTFGGNPLACAAANAVLDVILAPGFLADVTRKGAMLRDGLRGLVAEHNDVFEDVRGAGLMLGLKCRPVNTSVQQACLDAGLLSVAAGDNVLRLVPPLVVTDDDCAEAIARLHQAAAALSRVAEAA
jgi:acetylornithine/N-succinyldiaminopimelate aminotransferase